MNLSQKLLQKMIISQRMQQSLNILALSNEEILERVKEESLENPMLEWEAPLSLQAIYSGVSSKKAIDKSDEFFAQDHLPEPKNLRSFLLQQKDQSFYSEEIKNLIEILISYLDERAYLRVNIEEVALKNQTTREKVLEALRALQSFEPWGVGARNLEECLLIQIHHRQIKEPLLNKLILNHLDLLKDKKYPYIARELKVKIPEVKRLVELLKSLQPDPAFNFSFEPTVFVRPDIYMYRQDSGFKVFFNREDLPSLKVSSFYGYYLRQKKSLKSEERDYLQKKKKAADFLIYALQQREERIKQIGLFLARYQEAFLLKGFAFLKPLTMLDVAEELKVHISTVSRAVNNKYVHTPQGIIPLKEFFDRGISTAFVESASVMQIKAKLKKWLKEEDPSQPLSDEMLRIRLSEDLKVNLTRRRVAQYRMSLNIPASKMRKLDFLYSS